MGQTLTHGIYLPDEGERNCYDGLAGNWSILDGAVGTIAEHTTQIAGKAPLVHTHGKADVTDLLNSNFIPSANNAYDLGSSSYQWNNAYIKSLTINGVAAGDILTHNASEFVNVSSNQTIAGVKTFSNDIRISKTSPFCNVFSSGYIKGQAPTSNMYSGIRFYDDINSGSTNTITGGFEVEYNRDGYNKSYIASRNYAGENHKSFTVGLRVPNDDIRSIDFLPSVDNIVNLGTSTNQWKSLNGINPGALSFPSGGTTENTDWFNVAGDILPTGGNATSFSGATANYFTPAKDGWLALAVKQCSELSVWCENLKYGISIVAPDASLNRQIVIPVVAGKIYQILITGNSWASARLIMPKGNV